MWVCKWLCLKASLLTHLACLAGGMEFWLQKAHYQALNWLIFVLGVKAPQVNFNTRGREERRNGSRGRNSVKRTTGLNCHVQTWRKSWRKSAKPIRKSDCSYVSVFDLVFLLDALQNSCALWFICLSLGLVSAYQQYSASFSVMVYPSLHSLPHAEVCLGSRALYVVSKLVSCLHSCTYCW